MTFSMRISNEYFSLYIVAFIVIRLFGRFRRRARQHRFEGGGGCGPECKAGCDSGADALGR